MKRTYRLAFMLSSGFFLSFFLFGCVWRGEWGVVVLVAYFTIYHTSCNLHTQKIVSRRLQYGIMLHQDISVMSTVHSALVFNKINFTKTKMCVYQ